ncbi:sterol desaturase family protein [Pleionea sp. CnH1-48]|uniref:sterol desaturase family protein n=1 Tax=Pleionea sp. CnH1-48 TaxID=2954494 RepID=UPI0020979FF1|nr:sterol desaturase family protein [Pleionea sp. CnH1-48]MCO7225240.1 sterol desaturase family protein [Pleionea sp. CnH1-48]
MSGVIDKVLNYRSIYRETRISKSYNGELHAKMVVVIATSIMLLSLIGLEQPTVWQLMTIPVTFFYANVIEYAAHRWVMHRRISWLSLVFRRHTLQHHRFYTYNNMLLQEKRDLCATLFPLSLVLFFFIGFALPGALVVNYLFGLNVACFFIFTASAYYLMYEVFHTLYHIDYQGWITRQSWFISMKQRHQHHHDVRIMQHCNFNITFPITDWIMGTLYRDENH